MKFVLFLSTSRLTYFKADNDWFYIIYGNAEAYPFMILTKNKKGKTG